MGLGGNYLCFLLGKLLLKDCVHFSKLSEFRIIVCADVFRLGTDVAESLLFSFSKEHLQLQKPVA